MCTNFVFCFEKKIKISNHTKICSLPQHYCVHHSYCTTFTCDKGLLKLLHDENSNVLMNNSNDTFIKNLKIVTAFIINFYHLFFNQQICIKKVKGPFTTWTLSNIKINQFQMSYLNQNLKWNK